MKRSFKLVTRKSRGVTRWLKRFIWKTKRRVEAKPMTSFTMALGLLLAVILVVNWLGRPEKKAEKTEEVSKQVRIYRIGSVPTVSVQARVEKSGVVTVYAQTPGVVWQVRVTEGDRVRAGQVLLNLSSTYSGANSATISRLIAEKNYQNAVDNLEIQLQLLEKRRELAEKTDENSDKMRELSRESLDRTKVALELNEEILESLDNNLQALEALPESEENDTLILSTKQLKSQFVNAVNGLRDGIGNLEATSDDDDPAARLSDLGKDIALLNLDLEEKGLRLSVEIAKLNLKLARVGEMLFYPQAPFAGVVERVWVRRGELVNPGQPLVALAGSNQSVKLVALVGRNVAKNINRFEPSKLYWGLKQTEALPQYVASEPTSGNLYAITWFGLEDLVESLSNRQYVRVEIPIGYSDTSEVAPYLPLDAIYQTQDEAYVFVNQEGVVQSKKVVLGQVFGSYVEVLEGVKDGDEIILDRTVVTGERVNPI